MKTYTIEPLPVKYLDQLPVLMKITKDGNMTEIDFFNDMSQANPDIPDQLHGFEQGWADRKNELLDPVKDGSRWVHKMDDRHFREHCVQYAGRNYFVFLKKKCDLQPPQHLKAEWLAEKLETTFDIAQKLATGFAALEFDRKTALKFIYQELMPRSGNNEMLAATADWLEALEEQIKEPDWAHTNNYWQTSEDDVFDDNWIYLTDEVLEAGWLSSGDFDDDGNFVKDDGLDVGFDTNAFGASPLHWGNEALSHEFIMMIKEADHQKLRWIQSGFFKQKNGYIRYKYMTATQKSQAWVYIKERKAQLESQVLNSPSEDFKIASHWVNEFATTGAKKDACSVIFCFADRRTFDYCGIKISFSKKATLTELKVLWRLYKQLTKAVN